jgi:hypothetical protein
MHVMADTGENVRPINNCPGYYSDCQTIESEAALLLCIDPNASTYFGQAGGSKTDLLNNFIQYGIDVYYTIQTNPNPASRGDRCLSKWPCVFAGLLLGQPQFYANINYRNPVYGYEYFKTEACTYAGTPWTNATYRPQAYNNALFQMDPTDGSNPTLMRYEHLDPFTVGWCAVSIGGASAWRAEAYRRSTHSFIWVGTALAARRMNAMTVWGHAPFFDYCDRWMGESESSWFSALNALGSQAPNGPCSDGQWSLLYSQGQLPGMQFVRDMWALYR